MVYFLLMYAECVPYHKIYANMVFAICANIVFRRRRRRVTRRLSHFENISLSRILYIWTNAHSTEPNKLLGAFFYGDKNSFLYLVCRWRDDILHGIGIKWFTKKIQTNRRWSTFLDEWVCVVSIAGSRAF